MGILAGKHWKAFVMGGKSVRAEWQADTLQAEQQAENNRLLAQSRINTIDSKGAAKARKQAVTDQSLLAKVETNVPSTLPMLPGSFRVHHDADARSDEERLTELQAFVRASGCFEIAD